MGDKDLSYKIAGVIVPLLIYLVTTMIIKAALITVFIYFDVKMTAGSSVNVGYGYYFAEHMDDIINENAMLITLVAAVANIPVMLFIMAKDGATINPGIIAANIKNLPKAAFIAFPAGMALSAGAGRIIKMFPLDNIIGNYEESEKAIISSPVSVRIAALVIAVPVLEEILFRGVIYNRIKKHWGDIAGVCVSSLIFGIYHMNLSQGIYAFILGIILAAAYRHFNTLAVPVMLHAAANLTALIMQSFAVSRLISRNIVLGVVVSFVEIAAAVAMLFLCAWASKGRMSAELTDARRGE